MATSGSFTTTNGYTSSNGKVYRLKFEWERTSYSIENNTSTIKWTLKGYSTGTGYVKAQNLIVKIDGTEVYNHTVDDGQFNMYDGTVLGTGTQTIKHNNDGTKSFSVYIEGGLYVWAPPNATGTKSFTLDTIPRASTITATSVNIGSQTTITVKKATSSFTHTITYKFGSLTGTIATKSSTASIKWTVPTTFYAQIPNAKSGTCTLTCTTYNGSTSLGSKTTTFTATAAESLCKPLLAPVIEDINEDTVALTGDSSRLVKYYSKVNTQVNPTVRNSATLKSVSTKHNGKTTNTGQSTFDNVSTNVFDFSATDSRGYTTTQRVEPHMVNYIKPTCIISNTEFTTDGVIKFKIKGSYFKGSFGAQENVLGIRYRYKTKDGTYTDWLFTDTTRESNSYTADIEITGLDYRETYVIQARAVDLLETVLSNEITLSCVPVFDWSDDNFNFNVPIYMNDTEVLRINDEKRVVLAAENDIYLRPNGTSTDAGQLRLKQNGDLVYKGATLPFITTGTAMITLSPSKTNQVEIDFGCTFKQAPVVLVQQVFAQRNITAISSYVTQTGFTAGINPDSSQTKDVTRAFGWVAIGTLA